MHAGRPFAIVTAGMILMIAYGSLYPFDFSPPPPGPGPVHMLVGSWADRPGFGDFLANILLYAPLGFFGALGVPSRIRTAPRLLITVSVGTVLSITLELAQYYDVGRDTAATDVYANLLGTLFGAIAAVVLRVRLRWPLVLQVAANPIPALLVSTGMGYRLYPFVPTINLHKYSRAIKPLVQAPAMSPYDLLRHTAIWLVLCILVARIGARSRPRLLVALFAVGLLCSKILIISATLSQAEVGGALVAYAIWISLQPFGRRHLVVAVVAFALAVLAQRLEPFRFTAHAVPFGWIPFRSFMQGPVEIGVLSFLEKFFLYGSLIWLLTEIGIRRAAAAVLVAAALFAASVAETHLPLRSAEVTDAVMALAIAAIFGVVAAGSGTATPSPQRRESLPRPCG
jgi:VanZ family protein